VSFARDLPDELPAAVELCGDLVDSEAAREELARQRRFLFENGSPLRTRASWHDFRIPSQ
jgi:hypothetical protein